MRWQTENGAIPPKRDIIFGGFSLLLYFSEKRKKRRKYTKHFYIEGQRIVSKLGAQSEAQFVKSAHAGDSLASPVLWDKKKERSKDIIIANFEALGLDGAVFTAGKSGKMPYGQIKKYLNSGGSVVNPGGGSRPSRYVDENLQFYYHPDHLGSSNYITNASGEVYQHEEYFPFGETFVEERNSAEYTTYLFNGKELDEETGLYYYGARYYDSRVSIWQSMDPQAEKYPILSPYNYVANNPLLLIDPNGEEIWLSFTEEGNKTTTRVQYLNGKLLDEKGKEYKGNNSNILLVRDQLNRLKGMDSELSDMISYLEGGKSDMHTINIDPSAKQNKSDDVGFWINDWSSKITYNPTNSKNPDDPSKTRDPIIGLMHELAHSYDRDMFNNYNVSIKTYDTNGNDSYIDLQECNAIRIENIVRSNLPNHEQRKTYKYSDANVIIPRPYVNSPLPRKKK